MSEQYNPIQAPNTIHQTREDHHTDSACVRTIKSIHRDLEVKRNIWSKVQGQTLAHGEQQQVDAKGLERIERFVKSALFGRTAFRVRKDRGGYLHVNPGLAIPSPEILTSCFRQEFEPSEFIRVFL